MTTAVPALKFSSHHLVITTESRILCYDKDGLSNIFTSSSHGIVAAKEAKNGMLAIADDQLVVFHKIREGVQRSYRLKGTEGRIRLLEYSASSNILYFTTTLLNAVQAYDLSGSRLLEPGPLHGSLPTVVAVSPTSHLLLTASEYPPTVFITGISPRFPPLFFQPLASQAPVAVAAFHPERPNVFLLGFKDGTISALDASRMLEVNCGFRGPSYSITGAEGQIGTFERLHAVTTRGAHDPNGCYDAANPGGYNLGTDTTAVGARAVSITRAAFIPGYRCRAVSIGADGWCHIIDFDNLDSRRSWHVSDFASALSIFDLSCDSDQLWENHGRVPEKSVHRALLDVNIAPDIILAVGRLDGRVLLFDCSGKLRQEIIVNQLGGRLIDVEWVPGPPPPSLRDLGRVEFDRRTAWSDLHAISDTVQTRTLPGVGGNSRADCRAADRHQQEAAASPDPSIYSRSTEPAETLTEDIISTVKYQQIDGPIRRDIPVVPLSENRSDLLTPSKEGSQKRLRRSPVRRTSIHPRPRVTSATFRQDQFHSRSVSEGQELVPVRPAPVPERLWRSIDAARRYMEDEAVSHGRPRSARSGSVSTSNVASESGQSAGLETEEQKSRDLVRSRSANSLYFSASSYSPTGPISSSSSVDTAIPIHNARRVSITNPDHARRDSAGRIYFEGGRAERERFYSAVEFLPPGFAQSYYGPVEVERYLPRRSSKSSASTGNER